MGELSSALDALAGEDLHGLSDGLVLDRVAELVRVVNRATAELSRTVRHADATRAVEHDGLRSTRSWLIGHVRLSPAEASRVVRAGRVVEHFPALAAGFAAGEITAAQVDVVAAAVGPSELARAAEQDIDLGAFDRDWATIAAGARHECLVEAVTMFDAALDPDGREPDPTEGRRLSVAKHAGGGSGRFDLDIVGIEKVQATLESMVQASRPEGDSRTRGPAAGPGASLRAVGGCRVLSAFLRTQKPQVIVTIPLEDLVDPATGPGAATTGFGAVLSAARARWLACDASIRRLVLDPDGVPLDLGRTKRVVPAGLRQAVEHRDRHCVFAGCHAPTHWCDVHSEDGVAARVGWSDSDVH